MPLPPLPPQFSWADQIALGTPEVYRLSQLAWPRFLLEESDIPDPILKFEITVPEFQEKFKVFGLRETATGLLVAFIQAVHVAVDLKTQELPQMGWRFSIQNASTRSPKNALSLVEASIDSNFRGHGLSKFLLDRVKQEAREKNFAVIVAPVRPTLKTQFPTETIEAYCERRDERGRIFDPWLRTHVEAGAEIVNICHESARVQATLPKWREWTGLPFASNGDQLVEGALTPVQVDLAKNIAVYTEPNVWVKYHLKS